MANSRRVKRKTTKKGAKPRSRVAGPKTAPRPPALRLLAEANKHASTLLETEKRRRGAEPKQLVFVGVKNVAQYKWCAMYAVLKSRANEEQFFLAHLEDRVRAALLLGRPLPAILEKPADLLTVGSNIKWTEVPLEQPDGGVIMLPGNVSPEELYAVLAEGKAPSDPMARGLWSEQHHAEHLPSKRWSFEWGPFVVVGVPDGMGEDFVYEYKSTSSDFMLMFQRPVALAQADLYGYFFGKTRRRVDIRVEKEDLIDRIEGAVDPSNAEAVLAKFAALVAGGEARPPKPWKCNNCEYRERCPLL